MNFCCTKLHEVSVGIIVVEFQTQIHISGSMVCTCSSLLITCTYKDSIDIMHFVDGCLIVELAGEHTGLLVGTATDILHTRHFVIVNLSESIYYVCSLIVRPRRRIGRISIIISSILRCGIVYRKLGVERQTFQYFSEVDIHAGIKLELTAGILTMT